MVKNTRPSVILEIIQTGDEANYRLGVVRSCDYNYAQDNYQGHIKEERACNSKIQLWADECARMCYF